MVFIKSFGFMRCTICPILNNKSFNVYNFIISILILLFFFGITGIINSIGDLWKDQRKFLHDKLRLFGMTYLGNGKHIMEGRIMVYDKGTNLPLFVIILTKSHYS